VRLSIRPEDLYENRGAAMRRLRVNVFEGHAHVCDLRRRRGGSGSALRRHEPGMPCSTREGRSDARGVRPTLRRPRAHACLVLPEE